VQTLNVKESEAREGRCVDNKSNQRMRGCRVVRHRVFGGSFGRLMKAVLGGSYATSTGLMRGHARLLDKPSTRRARSNEPTGDKKQVKLSRMMLLGGRSESQSHSSYRALKPSKRQASLDNVTVLVSTRYPVLTGPVRAEPKSKRQGSRRSTQTLPPSRNPAHSSPGAFSHARRKNTAATRWRQCSFEISKAQHDRVG